MIGLLDCVFLILSTVAETTKSLLNRFRKRQVTFLGHIAGREGLKYRIRTSKMEALRGNAEEGGETLDSIAGWLTIEMVISIASVMKEIGKA